MSAYPREVTAAMVGEFLRGGAAVNVLARANGARVRVLDLGVDADGLPAEVTRHKVRRSSGAIDREDALTGDEVERSLAAGAAIADEEIETGVDLLVPGDMGIGNTTPVAALVGAALGRACRRRRGPGHRHRRPDPGSEVRGRRRRDGARPTPPRGPVALLRTAGSADIAAMTGFLVRAAERGTPVLLDGVVSGAAAVLAERLAPGASAWWCAGHRSTEPAHRLALDDLGLEPILDLGMRLGEATGALTALPVLRAAAATVAEMATLADVAGSPS